MKTSDPIANLLSSLSNAAVIKKTEVKLPTSKLKNNILSALKNEGVIKDFKLLSENNQEYFVVTIDHTFTHYKRLSKPGRRIYVKASKLPRKRRHIIIVSTSKGLMTAQKAIKNNIGGEVLLEVA